LTTEYLLEREVDLLLGLLTPSNRLVIQVSLHTGLRVSDVLNIKTAQVKPRFLVTESKTGKRRLVGLPADLREQLLAQAGEIWLFEHRTDPTKHRSRQAVWRDVKRAAEAMRLPQNVAPHSFRKVYAVDLMRKYGDIERVRRNLNHGGETVTTIYAMADLRLQQRQQLKAKRYGRR